MLQNMRKQVGETREQANNMRRAAGSAMNSYAGSMAQLAVVVSLALAVMVVPTSAAGAQAGQQTEAQVQAEAATNGMTGLMMALSKQMAQVQERLTSIEERLSRIEASTEGNSSVDNADETGIGADENVQTEARAEVTHNVEKTDGERAQVTHKVEQNGRTIVDFVTGLFGRAEKLHINVDGTVEAGNQVVVTVTYDGDVVENASVYANGELAGFTDTNGQETVTVPDEERLTIRVMHDDVNGAAVFTIGVDADEDVESSSGSSTSEDEPDTEDTESAEEESGTDEQSSDGSVDTSTSVESENSADTGEAEAESSIHVAADASGHN